MKQTNSTTRLDLELASLPKRLALICPACLEEVALVTADDLAGMDELPEHECREETAA